MTEQVVVNIIERQLKSRGRFYVNIHGTAFSHNGTPDILTLDTHHTFVGIEAKAPGNTPKVNQFRRFIEILQSGGRIVVAYDDFTIDALDTTKLPITTIGNIIGYSEFEARLANARKSQEIVLVPAETIEK